jgi:MFS transporter, DHA2 family, multidrug resistance protein
MTSTGPVRAGSREWVGLAVLALPLLVLSLDVSVLYLAAPRLAADLRASATQQLWVLDVYGFLIAGFLLTMGALGDRIGRRRLLLVGAAAFAAASLLAAFAPTVELLIAARALLGVSGATLMPSTLALISTMFRDPVQRSFAIAVWMTTFSAGVAIGPLVGGLLLEHFWWGSVFLLGVPAMALLLVLGPLLLPEERGPGTARPDAASVVLSLGAMLPLVYGVKQTAAHGPDVAATAAVLVGVGVGVAFVRRQRRLTTPMLDVALFARPVFAATVGLLLLGLLAVNGLWFLLPQHLQLVGGRSAFEAGLLLLPAALATVAGSLLTPVLARRLGRVRLVAASAALAAVPAALLVTTGPATPLPVVVALVTAAVLGIAPIPVLGTDLVVGSVPTHRAGSAAAVSETAGELGVALGVAVTGSVVTAVYGAALALPPALPPDAVAAAEDGLASAVTAAERLPAPTGDLLSRAAVDAFSTGFGVAGIASAVMLMGVVGLAVGWLRERAPDRTDPVDEDGARRTATGG